MLAQSDDLDQLGGIAVEIDHVAGLARGLRAGVHRHADIGLCKGWRIIGAVAAHRNQLAALLLAADQRQLVFGGRLGQKIIYARFCGNGGSGERIVAGYHHRADAHAAQFAEPFAYPGFDDVFQGNHPQQTSVVRHGQRGLARAGDVFGNAAQIGGGSA